jgi:hypothetical protein
MRYFLDTEFNGFGGALIAIALVPEDERRAPFYEAMACADPTPWVAANVLPVLGTAALPRVEVASRFAHYLLHDETPVLVADWPEDIAHAAQLLITGPGHMKPVRSLRFDLVDPDTMGAPVASAIPHNACSDAQALRSMVLAHEAWLRRV